MLFGVLNAVARMEGRKVMTEYFGILDQPLVPVVNERAWGIDFIYSTAFPYTLFDLESYYWANIGAVLALLSCFLRVIHIRKDAAETGLQEEWPIRISPIGF